MARTSAERRSRIFGNYIAEALMREREEHQLAADLAGLDLCPEALYAPAWSAVEALRGAL